MKKMLLALALLLTPLQANAWDGYSLSCMGEGKEFVVGKYVEVYEKALKLIVFSGIACASVTLS